VAERHQPEVNRLRWGRRRTLVLAAAVVALVVVAAILLLLPGDAGDAVDPGVDPAEQPAPAGE
jgi:hypothetical protein